MKDFFHCPTVPGQYQGPAPAGCGLGAVRDRRSLVAYPAAPRATVWVDDPNIHPQPYAGLGACGCTGMQQVSGPTDLEGLGASPILGSPTGFTLLDAGLGALVGYLVAKRTEDRTVYAIGGALAAYALGTVGLVGVAGAGLYARSK